MSRTHTHTHTLPSLPLHPLSSLLTHLDKPTLQLLAENPRISEFQPELTVFFTESCENATQDTSVSDICTPTHPHTHHPPTPTHQLLLDHVTHQSTTHMYAHSHSPLTCTRTHTDPSQFFSRQYSYIQQCSLPGRYRQQ